MWSYDRCKFCHLQASTRVCADHPCATRILKAPHGFLVWLIWATLNDAKHAFWVCVILLPMQKTTSGPPSAVRTTTEERRHPQTTCCTLVYLFGGWTSRTCRVKSLHFIFSQELFKVSPDWAYIKLKQLWIWNQFVLFPGEDAAAEAAAAPLKPCRSRQRAESGLVSKTPCNLSVCSRARHIHTYIQLYQAS